MVAQIRSTIQIEAQQRRKEPDPDTRVHQWRQVGPPTHHAAHPIEQQPDLHPGACLRAEMRDHCVADRVSPEHEGAHIKGVPRTVDQFQKRSQRFRAIGVDAQGPVCRGARLTERSGQLGRPPIPIGAVWNRPGIRA